MNRSKNGSSIHYTRQGRKLKHFLQKADKYGMIQVIIKGEMHVKKAKAWLLCAAWMGVIYVMSAMPGDTSGTQSGMIVDLVLTVVRLLFGPDAAAAISAELIELLVRKGAHMTEYAVLFCLYRRALCLSGARHPGMAALVMSACYAATDEWHQSFVADRGPSPVDVGIDTIGAALAWIIQEIAKKISRIRKKER